MDITGFVFGGREKAFLSGDYSTYRNQLSRQLLSLRRKLGRTTPKNQKYTAKASITAEDVGKSKDFVHLQLVAAERAWAHAMAMKSAHGEENTDQGVTGSTRRHILSRLHKATRYAEELVTILQDTSASGATAEDVLEAQAYSRCISGAAEFERQFSHRHEDAEDQKAAWNSCLVQFSEAHVIYTALLHSRQLDVFKEVLSGTVDPSIRYAAYQSRLPRTLANSTVAKQHFRRSQKDILSAVTKLQPDALSEEKAQTTTKAPDGSLTNIPTTVSWRGRTAPIADAAIGQALASTELAASQLQSFLEKSASTPDHNATKALAAAYDPVLIAAQDTVDAVRRALTDLNKEGVGESDSRMQDLRVTDLAANYALISWRIGRNRVLISSPPAPSSQTLTLDDGLDFQPLTTQPRTRRRANQPANTDTTTPRAPKPEPVSRQLARLTSRIALFDQTLQSIESATALRGAARDTAFAAELAAQHAYFAALRTLNIAASHKVLGHQRDALALIAAASARASAVDTSALGAPPAAHAAPTLRVSTAQLRALQDRLAAAALRQHGLVALQELVPPLSACREFDPKNPGKGRGERGEPLVFRLDEYAHDVDFTNLVSYPPKVEPVPVKPIFLDLAYNYIEYAERRGVARAVVETVEAAVEGVRDQGKGEATQQQQQQQRKSGWFGFGRS